eukprot:TRINITY_DN5733_c0_g1_i2.p2 TRINITY_DN5733_c0_g1~~TRINITY_DN5733_c0_g1_i2.p2  ORF type:complete len:230 (-),score=-17.60 TRINITY_DN5733_c0_g1_i2:319-1008(-)
MMVQNKKITNNILQIKLKLKTIRYVNNILKNFKNLSNNFLQYNQELNYKLIRNCQIRLEFIIKVIKKLFYCYNIISELLKIPQLINSLYNLQYIFTKQHFPCIYYNYFTFLTCPFLPPIIYLQKYVNFIKLSKLISKQLKKQNCIFRLFQKIHLYYLKNIFLFCGTNQLDLLILFTNFRIRQQNILVQKNIQPVKYFRNYFSFIYQSLSIIKQNLLYMLRMFKFISQIF